MDRTFHGDKNTRLEKRAAKDTAIDGRMREECLSAQEMLDGIDALLKGLNFFGDGSAPTLLN